MKFVAEENETFELVGFVNNLPVIPGIVHLIFKKENDSNRENYYTYFLHGIDEGKTKPVFSYPLDEQCVNMIKLFERDYISTNKLDKKKFSNGDKAIFAFQTADNFVYIYEYDEFVEFLKNYQTDDKILKADIEDFLSYKFE